MAAQSQEPYHLIVDVDRRIVIMELRGRVTLEGMLATAERVYADDRVETDFSTIVDIQTSEWALTFSDLHEYSRQISANPKMLTGRIIFVATTSVAYGIARMYQGTHDQFPSEMKFEQTVEAALKALLS